MKKGDDGENEIVGVLGNLGSGAERYTVRVEENVGIGKGSVVIELSV